MKSHRVSCQKASAQITNICKQGKFLTNHFKSKYSIAPIETGRKRSRLLGSICWFGSH